MVKTVFKTLLAIPVVIILGSVTVEIISLGISTQQLKNDISKSLGNACDSFNQESYLSTYLDDITDEIGNVYISGNVYNFGTSLDNKAKYNQLFGNTNSQYISWMDNTNIYSNKPGVSVGSTYDSVRKLSIGVKNYSRYNGDKIYDISGINTNQEMQDIIRGVFMVDSMYTPMNIGIPYIGTMDNNDKAKNAVQNIFRWNLAQMESQCNGEMIKTDGEPGIEPSDKYVQRNGWRVYVDKATISSIEYYLYDTQLDSDAEGLKEATSIDASWNANARGGSRYITVIKVGYSVPVQYHGITPIGKIFSWMNHISGRDGETDDNDGGWGVHNNSWMETSDTYTHYTSFINSEDSGYVYYYNID